MGKKRFYFLNKKIVGQEKAKISVRDIGILRGYGIFDFIRTYNGRPFLFEEHLERLFQNIKALEIIPPFNKKELKKIIKKLLAKNGFKESGIRIILTGGKTIDDLGVEYSPHSPTFFILVDPFVPLFEEFYQKGVNLVTYPFQREMPEIKTINYFTAIKALNFCKRKKAFDVLYVSDGFIRESTTSNFFFFRENKLITPQNKILKGTTRNLVIKLAKNLFKVEERDCFLKELKYAQEAFLTSTTKEILPVVKVDGQLIGNGRVGQRTKLLMKLFHDFVKKYST
jgi:branched-chain amino acid aminotransferase